MTRHNQAVSLAEQQTGPPSNIDQQTTTIPPAGGQDLPSVPRRKQLAVLSSAFATIALTIGYNQCFGVFQEYYLSSSQDVLVPSASQQTSSPTALLALVGTLCYGLTWSGGIFVNPILARAEDGTWASKSPKSEWPSKSLRLLTPRAITITGVLLMCLGFTLASLCQSIWGLLITQGLLVGFGMSLLYFPLLAPVPEYFTKHRATAMGFILAGGGTGGLVFSPILRALLSCVGGRWTLRIWAVMNLAAGIPVAWTVPRSQNVALAPPQGVKRRGTHVSRALAVRPAFIFSVIASFLYAAGAQLPLAFIPSYTVRLGYSASEGANLLAASNAINAVFRVFTGFAGDCLGRQNTLILTLFFASSSVFAFWLPSILKTSASSFNLWIAFIVSYNISAGGYYALFPALITDIFGTSEYAAVNGFILFVRGLGTMFGSPVGGQLLNSLGQGTRAYAGIAYWDGALLIGATLFCIAVRWADGRGQQRWCA